MNIQFITDEAGRKTHVVVPVAEYKSLLDNRDFDEAIADKGEIFPDTLVGKLLSDKNKIRIWRKYRRLTQQELGNQAGVSKEYISMLESGKRTGNIETIKKLASALEVQIEDIV